MCWQTTGSAGGPDERNDLLKDIETARVQVQCRTTTKHHKSVITITIREFRELSLSLVSFKILIDKPGWKCSAEAATFLSTLSMICLGFLLME